MFWQSSGARRHGDEYACLISRPSSGTQRGDENNLRRDAFVFSDRLAECLE